MSAALAILNPDDDFDPSKMSKDELRQAFSDCFGLTVAALTRAAVFLNQWKVNGWNVQELEEVAGKWVQRLRLIHSGQLLPELAIRFDAQPSLLSQFSRYHVDEQRKLATDAPLALLVLPGGEKDFIELPASRLLKVKQDAKQVFDRDHIRNLEEQRLWLEAERKKVARPKPGKLVDGKVILHIDRERGGLTHRGEFVPLHLLVEAVKALRN